MAARRNNAAALAVAPEVTAPETVSDPMAFVAARLRELAPVLTEMADAITEKRDQSYARALVSALRTNGLTPLIRSVTGEYDGSVLPGTMDKVWTPFAAMLSDGSAAE